MIRTLQASPTEDLTILATVKEELNIKPEDVSKDGRLARYIREASSMVAEYCNRTGFGRAQYEQTFRRAFTGTNRHFRDDRGLILHHDLNVQITSVAVDGFPLAPGDYEFSKGLLRRTGGLNAGWFGAEAVVVYWAGWELLAGVPPALERQTLELIGALHSAPVGRDPSIRSETSEGIGSTTYASGGTAGVATLLAPGRNAALDRYRRMPEF